MTDHPDTLLSRTVRFCLHNKLIVVLLVAFTVGWGVMTAPFDWDFGGFPRDPVPVDAIPDIGENQQIVFTRWPGRSPQDVEDQISYPLTVALLGVPGIKTIRSYSMFGFSTIYVIFDEDVEFYWSRSRITEKLLSLPADALPADVQPTLGPDATALGQVMWYTLEGRDAAGRPLGGWDLHELRSIQDWHVRYALMSADGVAEVASVGGFVQEYQIDVDPDAMRAHGVALEDVIQAVKTSNVDVGARTIEVNRVEYVIRGLGFIKNLGDIEDAVVTVNDNVPIYIRNVARVALGPALRRGVLDKGGSEVVGGVVVARFGENPRATITAVKAKIAEISTSLPRKTLPDGRVSQVTIVPFYDRSGLINETLATLGDALLQQILVTAIVVMIMVHNLRTSLIISGVLPLAVLMCFIAMRYVGVDANIVALSGIAIAIGTIVDMGIIVCENILKHLDDAAEDEDRLDIVYRATREVAGAVLTAVSTTIVSFLPVFTMEAAEGKLFRPLAFTKTFALCASILIALTIMPSLAHLMLARRRTAGAPRWLISAGLITAGVGAAILFNWYWVAAALAVLGGARGLAPFVSDAVQRTVRRSATVVCIAALTVVLTHTWAPLGQDRGLPSNFILVALLVGGVLGSFAFFLRAYPYILRIALTHKIAFLTLPVLLLGSGLMVWLGFDTMFAWFPPTMREHAVARYIAHRVPGLGKEFMPPLDEGSYLYMPVTMPHASIGEVSDVLAKQDMAFDMIPEIDSAVGKLGRADSPLDPAPLSMIETIINYSAEYLVDEHGHRLFFAHDDDDMDVFRDIRGTPVRAPDGQPYVLKGRFERDADGQLIPDEAGRPFRLWRPPLDPRLNPDRVAWPGVRSPDDIWDLIVEAARMPGTTTAPRLQPIAARVVMLQSGMRAPMGVKIKGPDLASIEVAGLAIESALKEVPMVLPDAVVADRIIGKPYLEIDINRKAIARYGITLQAVQNVIEVAIGGEQVTTTVEGRERYPVRVRYLRELRDNIEALERILVAAPDGTQVPLGQLADIEYVRGPQVIKSEDTFLVGYVLFDKRSGHAEVDVVEQARAHLNARIEAGDLDLPTGVSFTFAGSYENQVRSEKKLMVVLPLALFIIFLILYLQFRSMITTGLVFTGIAVAWAGGFVLIWLYGQSWFLDVVLFDENMRDLFQVHPINLSVAIWVGFLALFGIATDDGVVMAAYLDDSFARRAPTSTAEIRAATLEAGQRRVRPCLMTTATTILALLPVLTSQGRGADIMVPMAIPVFGGMFVELLTMLVVPVGYCAVREFRRRDNS